MTDEQSEAHVWRSTFDLAQRHTLAVYDAAYLELAQRAKLPIATLDTALINAALSDATPLPGNASP